MGILARFGEIMKSNINALLDSCENPEKMIDQTLRDLKESLAEVKKETAGVMAEEQRCTRELNKWKEEVAKWDDLARKAVLKGNDDDATQFLAKRNTAQERMSDAQTVWDAAHSNSEKMQQMYHKLENDISTLNSKRETLRAKVAVAKTQETINKANAKANVGKTMDSFGALEERINKRLDAANATAELDAKSSKDETDDLALKYQGQSKEALSDDLAKLKAEMGIR